MRLKGGDYRFFLFRSHSLLIPPCILLQPDLRMCMLGTDRVLCSIVYSTRVKKIKNDSTKHRQKKESEKRFKWCRISTVLSARLPNFDSIRAYLFVLNCNSGIVCVCENEWKYHDKPCYCFFPSRSLILGSWLFFSERKIKTYIYQLLKWLIII